MFPLEFKCWSVLVLCLPGRLLFLFLFLFLMQNPLKITVSCRMAVPQPRHWLRCCLCNTLALEFQCLVRAVTDTTP